MNLDEAFPQLKRQRMLKNELAKLKRSMKEEAPAKEYLDADDNESEEEVDTPKKTPPKKISIAQRQQKLQGRKRGVHGMNDLPKESFFDFLFGRSRKENAHGGGGRRLYDGAHVAPQDDTLETLLFILPLFLFFVLVVNIFFMIRMQRKITWLTSQISRPLPHIPAPQPSYVFLSPAPQPIQSDIARVVSNPSS